MGRKIRKILLVILLVIVILVLAGGIAYFVMKSGGEKAMKEDISNTELSMETKDGEEVPDDGEDDEIWYQGKAYRYNEDMVTILGMGLDETEDGSQADIVFLIAMDSAGKKTGVIAVPGEVMSFDSIKEEKMVDAVSELFYGIPIHGYLALDTKAIAGMNDAVGGVEVTVPEDLTKQDPLLEKGKKVTLKGETAYTFIHWLDSEKENAGMDRLNRQRIYLQSFFSGVKSAMKSNPSLPITLYQSVSGEMKTDLSTKKAVYLLTELAQTSLKMETLQGKTDAAKEKYQVDEDALYELVLRTFYKEVK